MSNIWIDAVFDRTQADVDRAVYLTSKETFNDLTDEEKAEFMGDLKGALNRSDLERIKNNIELLNEVLELKSTVSDIPELPKAPYYQELIKNVTAIRDAASVKKTTPVVPSEPLNTFQKWNDIELILWDVYDILTNNFHYYAGEQLFAGDSTALLL